MNIIFINQITSDEQEATTDVSVVMSKLSVVDGNGLVTSGIIVSGSGSGTTSASGVTAGEILASEVAAVTGVTVSSVFDVARSVSGEIVASVITGTSKTKKYHQN